MSGSPVAKKVKTMNFSAALVEVVLGKKLRRQIWPEAEFIFLKGDFLNVRRHDGVDYTLTVSRGDIEGTDYVVVE